MQNLLDIYLIYLKADSFLGNYKAKFIGNLIEILLPLN